MCKPISGRDNQWFYFLENSQSGELLHKIDTSLLPH